MPVPVSMPTRVASRMFDSTLYSVQLTTCGMLSGTTACAITCKRVAPHARRASTGPWLISSTTSMKLLVRNPKLFRNSARNPVNSLCLNENSKMNAHATTGMFRMTEASARTTS